MRSAKRLLVLLTILSLISYISCRKKTDEQSKPVSEPTTHKQKQQQSQQTSIEAQNETTTAPVKKINPPPVKEANQHAVTPQQPKKQIRPALEPAAGKTEMSATLPGPAQTELSQFASLKSPKEKIDWISEFSESHSDQIAVIAETAINDTSAEVRIAAMDVIIENETSAPTAVEKAITDSEEEVREKAVEACKFIDDMQAANILSKALDDQSELVRTMALQIIDEKKSETKLNVYKSAITSKYKDVKDEVVSALTEISSPQAVDVLIEGLKDNDTDFREDVIQAIDFLINHECSSYAECKSWWNANRNRFDNELNEIEETTE